MKNYSQNSQDELIQHVQTLVHEGIHRFLTQSYSSCKHEQKDYLGREFQALTLMSHSNGTKYSASLEDLLHLAGLNLNSDEMMKKMSLAVLTGCATEPPADLILHASIPGKFVDQFIDVNVLQMVSSLQGESIARELWGDECIWINGVTSLSNVYNTISSEMGKNPHARMIIFGQIGILTWEDDEKALLGRTRQIKHQLSNFYSSTRKSILPLEPALPEEGNSVWYQLLPVLRGALSGYSPVTLALDSSLAAQKLAETEGFLDTLIAWGQSGVHSLWSGIVPWKAGTHGENLQGFIEEIRENFVTPREIQTNTTGSPVKLMDPLPNIIFLPGLGIVAAAPEKNEANSLLQFVVNALAELNDSFASGKINKNLSGIQLPKCEASPRVEEFVGQVALITGAGSGIGRASAYQFAKEGAHVVVVDLNKSTADIVTSEINQRYGSGRAISIQCDVGDEKAVEETFFQTILTFGGVDIVVNNAGFAMSKTIETTELKEWDHIQNVMAKGYFLISREAFRIMRPQKMGGRLVFVCSKNSVRAGREISAYSSAKALELHLARCLAEEGGDDGIRVNSVLPDAVLKGSSLFDPALREDRAAQYGISGDQLENYYIQRTTLKVPIYPEHVAEAIIFLASDKSSRTTGGALTVDGGVSAAFLR
jgi:NAD(P)-dependent dehydrogenase (short-subunit alcohol dehydrogenase family)/rhamnose utilization protein RhaD (predicted bifunctional aldolase and dehydrogenase)